MGDVPEQVFVDAARASVLAHFPGRPTFAATVKVDVDEPDFRAAVESAYRAGQAAGPDGPQPDPKRTPEAAAEILARELYVLGHPKLERIARGEWYRTVSTEDRDGWRDAARRLLASLRESDLAPAWLTDATPAADEDPTHG